MAPPVVETRRRFYLPMPAMPVQSTRTQTRRVKALGLEAGISKSEVSRICRELDVDMEAFRGRSLGHVEFPYVFADATYIKGRVGGRVVSRAVVVATGVTASGDREVLGVDVGETARTGPFGPPS